MIRIPRSKQFEKNYQKVQASEYCLVCGRALNSKAHASVHTWLGAYLITKAEAAEFAKKEKTYYESCDSGFWLIGTDCVRRHPELKPYIV